jgi:hypothetical protein
MARAVFYDPAANEPPPEPTLQLESLAARLDHALKQPECGIAILRRVRLAPPERPGAAEAVADDGGGTLTLSLRARAPESPRATGGSHFGARGAGGSRRRSASASAEVGEGADSGGHDGGGAGMTDAQIKELNGCKTGAAREFVPRIRTGESRRLPCVQTALRAECCAGGHRQAGRRVGEMHAALGIASTDIMLVPLPSRPDCLCQATHANNTLHQMRTVPPDGALPLQGAGSAS